MSLPKVPQIVGTPKKKIKTYPVADKKRIVAEVEQMKYTFKEAAERYGITIRQLDGWICTFGDIEKITHKRPHYSKAHRRLVVSQIKTGVLTVVEAAQENQLSPDTIRGWLSDNRLSDTFPLKNSMQTSVSSNVTGTEAEKHVRELQLKIAALEAMINLAEDTYKIDIRKKCGTKQQ